MTLERVYDVEVHRNGEGGAQARYLVHGYDDVYWTDDLTLAAAYIDQSLADYENSRRFGKSAVERKNGMNLYKVILSGTIDVWTIAADVQAAINQAQENFKQHGVSDEELRVLSVHIEASDAEKGGPLLVLPRRQGND